ncbi:hypothetical protein AB0N73_01180 [Microbacterium sp. NPDC089189]|uniref:hypothetical protein n=1 Tax=Microbacterium sp. NPDC089189 TaxID=3154972 RepID=UPI00341E8303
MTYYADLAAALRARKSSEEQVLDVLRTVRETSTDSGLPPEDEFGPAGQYAENFSGSRTFTPMQLVRGAALLLSIAVLVALRLTVLRGVEFFPWGVLQGVAVFVVIGLTGDLVARGVSRRLPEDF